MTQPEAQRRALLGLSIGHFAVDIQSSGMAVLLPLIRTQLRLDYAAVGAIVAAQYLTSSVIQPLFGMISDRRPIREVLPIACLLAGLGTATALFLPSYLWVLLVVIVTGFGSAAYHATASLNANHVSGANKATGMSVFFSGGQLGYAFGPLVMVALLGAFGPRGTLASVVPAVVGCCVLLAAMPLYISAREWRAQRAARPRQSADRAEDRRARRVLMWQLLAVVVVICMRSVIQTGMITFIPLYFASLGPGNKEYAALLISIFVFAGAAGTIVGGPLADRFGRKPVVVGSMVILLPLLVGFLLSTGLRQVLCTALSGAILISASALLVVMAQDLLPNNVGLASGLTLGLAFGAGGLGALVLGSVADSHGITTTMWILALLPIPLVLLSFLLPGKARPDRAEHRQEMQAPQPEGEYAGPEVGPA